MYTSKRPSTSKPLQRISIFLALVLLITMFPGTALADQTGDPAKPGAGAMTENEVATGDTAPPKEVVSAEEGIPPADDEVL